MAIPTLKSSAVDSIPSMIDGLAGFLGKCCVGSVVLGLKHVDFYS